MSVSRTIFETFSLK